MKDEHWLQGYDEFTEEDRQHIERLRSAAKVTLLCFTSIIAPSDPTENLLSQSQSSQDALESAPHHDTDFSLHRWLVAHDFKHG